MTFKNIVTALFLLLMAQTHAQVACTVDVNHPGIAISPTLYGIFFEDINHAADGGLYAELVKNRSFEDNTTSPVDWSLVKQVNSAASMALDTSTLLNTYQKHALKLDVTSLADGRVGVANGGFWGINVVDGQQYNLTFFARCNEQFTGSIAVTLENTDGTTSYAHDTISGVTGRWQKFSATLTARGSNPKGRLVLSTKALGTIWFDVVSLFPPTFNNRPNGLRPDLAQMLADMHPAFMRFPGGCFIEGDSIVNAFRWKTTIGPIENRPGHKNFWSYRTSDGMGFHEFLQLSEDIGAAPLYVANCGMSHTTLIPLNAELDSMIQETLDAIEYANGSTTTVYGALRAANGHPKPFNLRYIEIGNENNFNQTNYVPRYGRFYTAIKQKYPDINCIANSYITAKNTDIVDEHYYSAPQFFMDKANMYDTYNRKAEKIYVGEYAVTSGCGKGNMIAALGEAAFMTGFERNSDVVTMASYAPIFINNNDRNWNPDIINFDAANSYGTPSYYVQNLFSNNLGDIYIPANAKNNVVAETVKGKIGLGSWATKVQYDDIDVSANGSSIFADAFTDNQSNWSPSTGTWSIASGVYAQTSTTNDCRTIGKQTFSDSAYTLTLKAKRTGGSEGFLIMFGYKDKNNYYWWNIGGWGNTKNAIEKCVNGSKSTISSVSGSIKSNQWYTLKIVFTKGLIQCYIDDVLKNSVETASTILYVSNTLQTGSNELISKIVNTSATAQTATLSILATTTDTLLYGSATVLSAPNANDENTFANPTKIVPKTTAIEGLPLHFTYHFPAYSVTILRLKIPNLIVNIPNKQPRTATFKTNLYPNPVENGNITLSLPAATGSKPLGLTVYDINGHKIMYQEISGKKEHTLDVTFLPKGMYLITIDGEHGSETQKLIIQ